MQNHNLKNINARLRRAGVARADQINWFAQLDSTNAWLLRQADAHARVCLAEWQSAGRGRRGRNWHAPHGGSVLMSIGWEIAAAAGLSLVAGLAAADALRARGINSVKLKWPNDIVSVEKKSYGKKLGGILVETRGDLVVIGVGINVDLPNLPEGGVDLARLNRAGMRFDGDRDALAAELIIALCNYLAQFCAHGFAPLVEQWNRLNIHCGKLVELQLPDEKIIRARVIGADDDGALLVEHNGIRRKILSATLRAADEEL